MGNCRKVGRSIDLRSGGRSGRANNLYGRPNSGKPAKQLKARIVELQRETGTPPRSDWAESGSQPPALPLLAVRRVQNSLDEGRIGNAGSGGRLGEIVFGFQRRVRVCLNEN